MEDREIGDKFVYPDYDEDLAELKERIAERIGEMVIFFEGEGRL